jgi:HSP20 family molecular chaperone IbpA
MVLSSFSRQNYGNAQCLKVKKRLGDFLHHLENSVESEKEPFPEASEVVAQTATARLSARDKQKQNLITVTIQKTSTAADQAGIGPATSASPLERSDREVLERMARMHQEMDQMFKDAFEDIPIAPEQGGFFDEPRFGYSVVLHDEDENDTVLAYLPGRELKNLNVTVEGQTLRIGAQAEASEEKKASGITSSYKARYLQTRPQSMLDPPQEIILTEKFS